ncbi:GAF and HTH_10 associated domain-containing protein [Halogeometricum rufum]|uniref:GAF and HTH_10 associated domain-containing protein n=1 Tax=Halogeometricum rufum TaxID=553469 RepID=A0A1I6GYV7_9EURY|nr:helix-turn-helix domain-containing protein [Halogeometricum rufum]SFR47241.1 GAF and HTH_10 associated domain-containing protein [Halogeometricum rufum]
MTSIATLRADATEFLLDEAFRAVPTLAVEVPPVVAHGPDDPFPFLAVTGADPDTVLSAFADDDSVREATCLSRIDDGGLFRVEWAETVELLLGSVVRTDATVLSVRGTEGTWRLRLLAPDRDCLDVTFDFLADHGVEVELDGIRRLDADDASRSFGLSEAQYAALITGLDRGFYDVPRDTDCSELAAELGITHQALSERLRRAHGTLVENALASGSRVFN